MHKHGPEALISVGRINKRVRDEQFVGALLVRRLSGLCAIYGDNVAML